MSYRLRGALLLVSTLMLGACAASSYGPGMDRAQAEFDAGRWEQAAVQLAALAEDPSTPEETRHVAELRLALSLQRLGLRAASMALLKTMAGRPEHAARNDAFQALLPLALDLPSAAGVEAPLLQFDQEGREGVIARLPAPAQSRVRFLVGRFEYENKDYPRAIAQLEKVKGGDLARALILIAQCHVQTRESVPAAAALEKALTAAAALPAPESARLSDHANMLLAQLFFSAGIQASKNEGMFVVDGKKAAAALKYWKKIDAASPLAVEAQWQRAWIELAMGDTQAALAGARSAAATPGAYVPEAEQIEATVRWGTGEKAAALASFRAFVKKYTSVHDGLRELLERLGKEKEPDDAAFALLARANAHPDELPEVTRLAVAHALGDRQVRESLEYADLLDEDGAQVESLGALQGSGAAAAARKALVSERKALVHRTAAMVRARLTREADELQVLLREVGAVLPPGG